MRPKWRTSRSFLPAAATWRTTASRARERTVQALRAEVAAVRAKRDTFRAQFSERLGPP